MFDLTVQEKTFLYWNLMDTIEATEKNLLYVNQFNKGSFISTSQTDEPISIESYKKWLNIQLSCSKTLLQKLENYNK